ncbi:hypothetical protein AOLI_G00115230 [Acnodon oligacanthus]
MKRQHGFCWNTDWITVQGALAYPSAPPSAHPSLLRSPHHHGYRHSYSRLLAGFLSGPSASVESWEKAENAIA